MVLCYLIFISFTLYAHGIKLHEHMTKAEIEATFNCDHKLVDDLEYIVTPIVHIDGLEDQGQTVTTARSVVHFQAFDKNYSLYLEQNDNVLLGSHTPLFTARLVRTAGSLDEGPEIVYSRKTFPIPDNLKLYDDVQNRAAITVLPDEDKKAHMHGVIEDDLIVKPIPARLHEQVLPMYPKIFQLSSSFNKSNGFSNEPFSDFLGSGNFYKPTPHIVMKPSFQVNPDQQWNKNHIGNNGYKNLNKSFVNGINPQKQPSRPSQTQPPVTPVKSVKLTTKQSNTVYPELLISVDYETYEFHGSDIKQLATYMAAFWNAVDLRFRELKHPKVRLNIADLIVAETKDSTPYIKKAAENKNLVLASDTLYQSGKYFAQQNQFPKDMFDLAVVMTHLNIGRYNTSTEQWHRLGGVAALGGACNITGGYGATLIKDKGGFNGITTAAHELGNTMGAPHDDDTSRKIPGGPCAWSDGYLMSYVKKDSRTVHWSLCSKIAMNIFFQSKQSRCLKDKPNVGTPYQKILPGLILSRDEQCQRSLENGYVAIETEISNCAILHCQKRIGPDDVLGKIVRSPAEGSYCGIGAICLDAKCVKDPELN